MGIEGKWNWAYEGEEYVWGWAQKASPFPGVTVLLTINVYNYT